MRFEVDGPAFADEGDEVQICDAIRRGDLVWFDRVEPNKVMMRLVTGEVASVCYRIDRGSDPDILRVVAEVPRPA